MSLWKQYYVIHAGVFFFSSKGHQQEFDYIILLSYQEKIPLIICPNLSLLPKYKYHEIPGINQLSFVSESGLLLKI